MLATVPHPRPIPLADRSHRVGYDAEERRFGDPCPEHAVEHHPLQLVAVDTHSGSVDLVIHATRSVVVRAAVEGGDVVRELHTAPDLADDFSFERLVRVGRLFRFELRDVPALGQRHHRALFDRHLGECVDLVNLRSRGVAVEKRRKICGGLRCCDHSLGVAPHGGE